MPDFPSSPRRQQRGWVAPITRFLHSLSSGSSSGRFRDEKHTHQSPHQNQRKHQALSWFRLFQLGTLLLASAVVAGGCIERPAVEQRPTTNNVFVRQVVNDAVNQIDLLFVIDNSVSMGDKQAILRKAVPIMVRRLVTPDCVDESNNRRRNDNQDCTSYGAGFAPEFQPVDDIHIGVITSSLGGFGGKACNSPTEAPQKLDKSLLIPKVRETVEATGESVPDPHGTGFLEWNPVPDGADRTQLAEDLEDQFEIHVAAAGESGCGFEAPLESWYRFLVDPAPPKSLELQEVGNNSITVSTGPDHTILAQREEFLRSGSLTAIVVLTDEDDCSAMEGGSYYRNAGNGWMVTTTSTDSGAPWTLRTNSEACDENPNDKCCYSCFQTTPAGCTDTCNRDNPTSLPPHLDRPNVRCFDNKRRFGIDLLYPTQRYVDALSKARIVNSRTGQLVPNPLLAGRAPDRVFFAGIVGVPWQDVATQETLDDPQQLEYMTAEELRQVDEEIGTDRWAVILGRPYLAESAPACNPPGDQEPHPDCGKKPVPPLDPFMQQSIEPRSGSNPITGTPIVQLGTGGWSDINGHEYDNSVPDSQGNPLNDDLQYSCIFPLSDDAIKVDCDGRDHSCDCGTYPEKNRPLCKPTPDSAQMADTTQRYGKAYPASRILRVLRDFGKNSIVGSICPKIVDEENPDFGYNPAVNAIVDRLADELQGQCLPRELSITDGQVPCRVVEATVDDLSCEAENGRNVVPADIQETVRDQLEASGRCTRDPSEPGATTLCSSYNMCEIAELTGEDEQECFSSPNEQAQAPGFCYIDPIKGPAAGGLPGPNGGCLEDDPSTWGSCTNPNLGGCGPTERRMLRFVGPETPHPNSTTFIACAGQAASEGGQLPSLPAVE